MLIIFIIGLTGCSKGSAEKKPSNNAEQKPKAPSELKTIAADLDTIISELDKKLKQKNALPMQQNIQLNPQEKSQGEKTQEGQTQNNQSQEGGQSQDKQSQSDQSQSEKSSSGQSDSSQTQSKQSQTSASQTAPNKTEASKDWQKEFERLRNIHTSWNSVMPEAVQAGMSIEARNQFTKALDQLTQEISKQQPGPSLSAALSLYKNYADMAQVFSTSIPAEFYQVKYEIMAAIFEGSQKNWTKAEEHVPKMKEHWLYLGAQAKDTDSKMLSKTEFAILDLEQAIKSKQSDLVMIKGEIAMTNLKSLEEKLSKSKGSSQNESSDQNAKNGSKS
jgi:hypothetical protein